MDPECPNFRSKPLLLKFQKAEKQNCKIQSRNKRQKAEKAELTDFCRYASLEAKMNPCSGCHLAKLVIAIQPCMANSNYGFQKRALQSKRIGSSTFFGSYLCDFWTQNVEKTQKFSKNPDEQPSWTRTENQQQWCSHLQCVQQGNRRGKGFHFKEPY